MIIKIPVRWEMTGCVEIDADSIKEGLEFFRKNSKILKMPKESEFTEGSIRLIFDSEDFVKIYNQMDKI